MGLFLFRQKRLLERRKKRVWELSEVGETDKNPSRARYGLGAGDCQLLIYTLISFDGKERNKVCKDELKKKSLPISPH